MSACVCKHWHAGSTHEGHSLRHPFLAPDMVPYDFLLFFELKRTFDDITFDSAETVEYSIMEQLLIIPKFDLGNAFSISCHNGIFVHVETEFHFAGSWFPVCYVQCILFLQLQYHYFVLCPLKLSLVWYIGMEPHRSYLSSLVT
jgi:hypothetical protein